MPSAAEDEEEMGAAGPPPPCAVGDGEAGGVKDSPKQPSSQDAAGTGPPVVAFLGETPPTSDPKDVPQGGEGGGEAVDGEQRLLQHQQKGKFCDSCSDCAQLIWRADISADITSPLGDDCRIVFSNEQVSVLYHYLGVWVQKQCVCIFRDGPTVERFCLLVQNLTKFCVQQLKNLGAILELAHEKESAPASVEERWTVEETDRLLLFMAKIFMLQFPLYAGPKQVGHRFEEPSTAEATQLAVFCDVHDSSEFPVALLRNVTLFCKSGGLQGMASAFKLPSTVMPPSMAHALISILCNIKLWLNYRAVLQLFGPVRSNALLYMTSLSDMELRMPPARNMADFLWCSVKENIDSPIAFDKDGLELAFKYFCSSTLTMRLAGIAQINSHINLFNEMCNTESVVEVENVGLQLAAWILQNKIVEHIFGPNLHVEVIKQAHILLNFLAVEGKISNDHINVVWQASQLKHCAKQVQDLLLPLIKNLEAGPVLHLYDLMKELPVKEHTEQTIHLAQVLQKFIWTSGGALSNILQEASALQQQQARMKIKANSVSSSDDDPVASGKGKTKTLLEKSAITSSECEFSIRDLDELDDDINEYSDDEEEEVEEEEEDEEEEEEEDDEEDELQTSEDDETVRDPRLKSAGAEVQRVPCPTVEIKRPLMMRRPEAKPVRKLPLKGPSGDQSPNSSSLPRLIPLKEEKASPGKRTKGLPVKGIKRTRLGESSDSEEDQNAKKATGGKKKRVGDDRGIQGELLLGEKAACWWPSTSSASSPPIAGPSTAMAELANLVNAHPRSARPLRMPTQEVLDMRPMMRTLSAQRERDMAATADEGGMSGENESMSSRLSDKNLADFEDENSVDEEEMLQLAQTQDLSALLQQQQQFANMALYHQRLTAPRLTARQQREGARIIAHYKLDSACDPGNTLLWDLLQDANIEQLSDGLVNEAEKALTSLLCYSMERFIRVKFIEGCLSNIARNMSVAISLRLLPKLIQSFHHFRGMDTHEVCMFTERKHSMTRLFFDNLKIYTREHREGKECPFFNHLMQIQIRLQFLTVLFSVQVSPIELKLNAEQINVLWESLANDPICADDLFQYLLLQVHSKEQHAIGLDGFKLIYNEKLPTLQPESISMLGLNLFSQLCQLSRLTRTAEECEDDSNDTNVKMDQLWKIALCAQNTDVSMKAIQILNSVYFGQGEEFLATCMSSLQTASLDLASGRDEILIRIQRALLLLKTYLESFRRRYAYHIRRMSIEGQGVSTHAELVDLRTVGPIRVIIQAAGFSEKVTLEMQAMDLVADLRAETAAWWEGKLAQQHQQQSEKAGAAVNAPSPLLGSMLNEGPLRLITQGQELTVDVDEKSLLEMGFKDCQLVFISQGATRGKIQFSQNPDLPPFPGKDHMPMNLLLLPKNFDQLFTLMQNLSSLKVKNEKGELVVIPKAQILSRRVWDILMLLPTNPHIKQALQNIGQASEEEMKRILSPDSPQKLMYTFYIVDWLGRPTRLRRHSGVAEQQQGGGLQALEQPWIQQFIRAGGLKHLFDIFSSGQLQNQDSSVWCEWKQDCLSALLKLLVQFGVDSQDYEALADQLLEASSTPRKRLKRSHGLRQNSGGGGGGEMRGGTVGNHLLVPRLSSTMLQLMNVDVVMPRITSVLLDASRNKDLSQYRTGVFGRAQVVHFEMSLLVAWLYSVDGIEDSLFASNGLPAWLRNLLLDDPDPSVRRELCTGLYKMCMGSTTTGRVGISCTAPLLSILMEFLDDALTMTPTRRETLHHAHLDEGKEPYGPACRDYFWIMCRLVDNLHVLAGQPDVDAAGIVDIDQLARQLACGIVARKLYEKRHGDPIPDDALVGALNLLGSVMKHEPPFKTSQEGEDFILHLLECLFALPTPRDKDLPKCKSTVSRSACYDLLVEMVKGSLENYLILHGKLLDQHKEESHLPYQWDYWPKEDGRSECGYVGLTNLGATCYMASCVQQLYMIPQARSCVLRSQLLGGDGSKHFSTLEELQKMFAYLRESERKAYNPLSFCKTYQMDHQTLNTGEQKDMAEFFIDLLSKMEDMSPDLKKVVKSLFVGTLTNNVVSLDCSHVSRTLEEFFTVRCQVSEMRNLYQSLEEVTVKDTLEGDNMYTCSQCGKKVRAEKRACFKRLPRILAFNTMRYTFNMITMLKEKVNTHFSFPFRLDMSPYMEDNLLKKHQSTPQPPSSSSPQTKPQPVPEEPSPFLPSCEEDDDPLAMSFEYELIGVTVHTGTADGGHYYAFIRDRASNKDKWYSFNDAEVKPFDPNQIAAECFGGEMNSRTYDQVTDKFMDLSIEKTNSAYMLFYERVEPRRKEEERTAAGPSKVKEECGEMEIEKKEGVVTFDLSKELEDWIWKDNMNFIQDNNIFDHTYFNFMWQMVGFIPTTLSDRSQKDITLLSAKLATSFFLESFIHAKEKLNIVQWVELLTKQFDSSTPACSWFLDHMASDTNWPVTIFLKCQVATIRQMFHRLCIHVIQKLRAMEKDNYLLPWSCKDPDSHPCDEIRMKIGSTSPVTRFVRMLLGLLESGVARPHLKYLTELFRFLYDFAKLGEEETRFLLSTRAIASLVDFYLKAIKQNSESIPVDVVSDDDDDDDDDIIALPMSESNKMASLDKMVWLIALLVEKSRGDDNRIHLDPVDNNALVGNGGKALVFLFNVTKDNINICQTCNLIFSLSRNNPELAEQIAAMVFHGVKQADYSVHFFRLLTLLTEFSGGPSGMPCFTSLVMHKVWELAKTCPQAALDWLSIQVARNRYVQTWLLSTMESWIEAYLLAHPNQKVRNSAAFLVVSLVPSPQFRQAFRSGRSMLSPIKEPLLSCDEMEPLHQILEFLLGLLPAARNYVDLQQHGPGKLVAYLQAINHCLLTRTEKRMFEPHFVNLWQLFHPKLSEPSIPVHHNKQALLNLWYSLCVDCPENVRLILQNPHVLKNIAFNYILADHEDSEVINFNRNMLPAYYGLLRMCCLQSRGFTRTLAQHQNIQWAFKNITPYTTQYTLACDELFKLMTLFVQQHADMTEEEEAEVRTFRHQTLQLYLSILDGRSAWSTLINVLKILVDSNDDRIFVVYNNGFALIFDALNMLHVMFHEATACHVSGELVELLQIFQELLKAVRSQRNTAEITQVLSRWKDMADMAGRTLTLCNSWAPPEMREVCFNTVKEMLMLWPQEMLNILVPMLHRAHSSATEGSGVAVGGLGPFFPRKGGLQLANSLKSAARPPRPMLHMCVPTGQLEAPNGQDPEYDRALQRYFMPYHSMIDLMVRLAVNEDNLSKMLVDLSAMVGLDGVPLHLQLFPKLWLDIHNTEQIDRKFIAMLLQSNGFLEYVDAVLLDERSSLNNAHIFNFLLAFFPRVADKVLTDQIQSKIIELVRNFTAIAGNFVLTRPNSIRHRNGDLRALLLVNTARPDHLTPSLLASLRVLKERVELASQSLMEESNAEAIVESLGEGKAMDNTTPGSPRPVSSFKVSLEGGLETTNEEDAMTHEALSIRTAKMADATSSKTRNPSSSNKVGLGNEKQQQREIEEKAKLREALAVFLTTLALLVEMCENKIKVRESAAVLAAAAAAAAAVAAFTAADKKKSSNDESSSKPTEQVESVGKEEGKTDD